MGYMERAVQRLTLLYKPIHKLIAINTDSYQSTSSGGVHTRKQSSISFDKLPASKDCYKYSLLTRTFSEWNCLPLDVRNAPSLDIFRSRLKQIDMNKIIQKAHFQVKTCSVDLRLHVTSRLWSLCSTPPEPDPDPESPSELKHSGILIVVFKYQA